MVVWRGENAAKRVKLSSTLSTLNLHVIQYSFEDREPLPSQAVLVPDHQINANRPNPAEPTTRTTTKQTTMSTTNGLERA